MHLPKLPPLRPSRSAGFGVRLPKVQTKVKAPINIGDAACARRFDWGAIGSGRWAGTDGRGGVLDDCHGTCDRCGAVRRATDLALRDRPFGRGEWNVCEGGC
jgi:hypothetical protein